MLFPWDLSRASTTNISPLRLKAKKSSISLIFLRLRHRLFSSLIHQSPGFRTTRLWPKRQLTSELLRRRGETKSASTLLVIGETGCEERGITPLKKPVLSQTRKQSFPPSIARTSAKGFSEAASRGCTIHRPSS